MLKSCVSYSVNSCGFLRRYLIFRSACERAIVTKTIVSRSRRRGSRNFPLPNTTRQRLKKRRTTTSRRRHRRRLRRRRSSKVCARRPIHLLLLSSRICIRKLCRNARQSSMGLARLISLKSLTLNRNLKKSRPFSKKIMTVTFSTSSSSKKRISRARQRAMLMSRVVPRVGRRSRERFSVMV
jgi:hypothetical protein